MNIHRRARSTLSNFSLVLTDPMSSQCQTLHCQHTHYTFQTLTHISLSIPLTFGATMRMTTTFPDCCIAIPGPVVMEDGLEEYWNWGNCWCSTPGKRMAIHSEMIRIWTWAWQLVTGIWAWRMWGPWSLVCIRWGWTRADLVSYKQNCFSPYYLACAGVFCMTTEWRAWKW